MADRPNIKRTFSRYRKAIAEQMRLKRSLDLRDKLPKRVKLIGGVDVSSSRFSDRLYGSIVVMEYDSLAPLETVYAEAKADFPYIPGLLAFREMPVVLKAFAKLSLKPDILMFDGQGIAHPRRFGIASHAGVILGIPTIGCAKSRLYGSYREPANTRGGFSKLYDEADGGLLGYVLRTKNNVKPVFISPGHMISARKAMLITLQCTRGFRLPLPTRNAHISCNEARKKKEL